MSTITVKPATDLEDENKALRADNESMKIRLDAAVRGLDEIKATINSIINRYVTKSR